MKNWLLLNNKIYIVKKACFFASLFMFYCLPNKAQLNLVPNPSFEDTLACPQMPIIIANYLKNWYSPNNCSPDYYHTCSFVFPVPNSTPGYQVPRTGNGRVGMFVIQYFPPTITNGAEYIQAQLLDSLKSNTRYCVSFYLNVPNRMKYTSSSFGAYLGGAITASGSCSVLNSYTPQVVNGIGNFITDTVGWTKVEGVFTASGGEKYITLGNFNNVNNTDTLVFNQSSTSSGVQVYFYIDDVSVIELSVDAGEDTSICIGESLTLGEQQPDTGFHQYYWYTNGVLTDSLTNTLNINPTTTTTYVLEKRLCQSVYDTVVVTVKQPYAPADIIPNTISVCNGDSVTLPTINTIGSTQWNWQPPTNIDNIGLQQPSVFPTITTSYTVTADFANASNYCNNTFRDSITVTVLNHQNVQTNADTIVCIGEIVQFTTNTSAGTYNWLPSTGLSDATISNPYLNTALMSTAVTYTVTKTDNCGTSSDSITVMIKDCTVDTSYIIIPNVFSPNADGINDVFQAVLWNTEITGCVIFNRWGLKVFESTSTSKTWDGRTTSGVECTDGTYFYVIEAKNVEGQTQTYKGFVSLVR